MIRITELLSEGNENRVTLTRVETLLGNVAQELGSKEKEKLVDMYTSIKELSDSLNKLPYTAFNNDHWQLLKLILRGKVAEMIIAVEDTAEKNKEVDCASLKVALQTILTY